MNVWVRDVCMCRIWISFRAGQGPLTTGWAPLLKSKRRRRRRRRRRIWAWSGSNDINNNKNNQPGRYTMSKKLRNSSQQQQQQQQQGSTHEHYSLHWLCTRHSLSLSFFTHSHTSKKKEKESRVIDDDDDNNNNSFNTKIGCRMRNDDCFIIRHYQVPNSNNLNWLRVNQSRPRINLILSKLYKKKGETCK